MAKVVGLDASLTGFGVAVLEDGELFANVIESKKTGVQRLVEIREEIRQVVRGSDLVCIEDFAFSRANQAHNLGGLGWIIRVMMTEENVPFTVVGTGQVKKFATGKGNAGKPEIMLGVFKRWGEELTNDNAADAFVLMKIAEVLAAGGIESDLFGELPKFQREVIQEITNPGTKKKKKGKTKGGSGKKASRGAC